MRPLPAFCSLLIVGCCTASVGDGTPAERIPIVLELFTSEGCSSCPPADKLLQTLDESQPFERANLIVLSEHVDYWNESWVDPYSSKLFSQRQQEYAEHFGLGSVYTPQVVVDGREEAVGNNASATEASIRKALTKPKIKLSLENVTRAGNAIKLHVSSGSLTNVRSPLILYVALAESKVQSNISRGENAKRSLTHVSVVRSLVSLGRVATSNGVAKDATIALPSSLATNNLVIVSFLQDYLTILIVGAAQVHL